MNKQPLKALALIGALVSGLTTSFTARYFYIYIVRVLVLLELWAQLLSRLASWSNGGEN